MRFKDERHMLREWITHHLEIGVQHFWLIDNGSTDNYDLSEFSNRVTLFHIPNLGQKASYNRVFRKIKRRTKWLAVLDADEFLYSSARKSVIPSLRKMNRRVTNIWVRWQIFAPLNLLLDPVSKIDSIRHRLPKGINPGGKMNGGKTICRARKTRSLNIHKVKTKGRPKRGPQLRLRINHYRFPSYEACYGNKEPKGGGHHKKRYSKSKDPLSGAILKHKHILDENLASKSKALIRSLKEKQHTGPKIYPGRWKKRVMPMITRIQKQVKNKSPKEFHRIVMGELS